MLLFCFPRMAVHVESYLYVRTVCVLVFNMRIITYKLAQLVIPYTYSGYKAILSHLRNELKQKKYALYTWIRYMKGRERDVAREWREAG